MSYKQYTIKDDNFEALKEFGFMQSKVSCFPIKLMKVVDLENKYILEVCNEAERSYNMWSGKDWKEVGVLHLWKCKRLDIDYEWRNDELSPYYECDRTYNELIESYIQDLIGSGLIQIKEVK